MTRRLRASYQEFLVTLNGRWHRKALFLFMVVVIAHWAEHIAQAVQIWALGWPVPEARGALGLAFPWLVESEWLHYGYALVMLIGMWMLRSGFTRLGYIWWMVALGLQFWHHFEHLLLLTQAMTGLYLDGRPAPTSLAQLWIPRVELHLFYNSVVTLPMLVAMYYLLRDAVESTPTAPQRVATHQAITDQDTANEEADKTTRMAA